MCVHLCIRIIYVRTSMCICMRIINVRTSMCICMRIINVRTSMCICMRIICVRTSMHPYYICTYIHVYMHAYYICAYIHAYYICAYTRPIIEHNSRFISCRILFDKWQRETWAACFHFTNSHVCFIEFGESDMFVFLIYLLCK